jgi:siroheme synthase
MDKRGSLVLCSYGLSVNQITLETLAALRDCDVVCSEALSEGSRRALESICPPIEPLNGRRSDEIVESLISQVRKGRKVAYLTCGDPMVWNERCETLVARCEREGLDHRVYRGISYLNELLGILRLTHHAGSIGVHVRSMGTRVDGFNVEVPALVFLFGHKSKGVDADLFIDGVQRAYPEEHGLEVLCSVHAEPGVLHRKSYRVRELRRAWEESDDQNTLYIPAVAKRRDAARGRKANRRMVR